MVSRRSLAAGCAALAVLAGLLLSRDQPTPEERVSVPGPSPQIVLRTLPQPTAAISKVELVDLARRAADAFRAQDEQRFREAFRKMTQYGAAAQRFLAELLLEIRDPEERMIVATALEEIATEAIGAFALSLIGSDLPEDSQALGIRLVTRFRTPGAAEPLRAFLFQSEFPGTLKGLLVDFFAAVGAADILAAAALDPALSELRTAAANALAGIGTPEAARFLFEGWKCTFEPSSGRALSNYHLLEALGKFDPALLRDFLRDVLRSDLTNSHKNVFLSLLGKSDPVFARESILEVLANEQNPSVRRQAIYVLSALGGVEAQEMLLEILAKGPPLEALESANALLAQENPKIPFDRVRALYAATQDPKIRAVLASVLARYEEELILDPAFGRQLLRESEWGMADADPSVRGLSIRLTALLSATEPDAPDRLLALYGSLSGGERDAFPVVFAELAKQARDGRVRAILESSIGDESASIPQRLLAADALWQADAADSVYRAIAGAKDPQVVGLMSGIALAHGGESVARRLTEIAQTSPDPEKRRILEEQVQVWVLQK